MRVPPPPARRSRFQKRMLRQDRVAGAVVGAGCLFMILYVLLVIAIIIGVGLAVWKYALS